MISCSVAQKVKEVSLKLTYTLQYLHHLCCVFRYADSGDMAETFPYRAKAMFAFEEIDGVDVCFFGMHVQEYGSDAPLPNTR